VCGGGLCACIYVCVCVRVCVCMRVRVVDGDQWHPQRQYNRRPTGVWGSRLGDKGGEGVVCVGVCV